MTEKSAPAMARMVPPLEVYGSKCLCWGCAKDPSGIVGGLLYDDDGGGGEKKEAGTRRDNGWQWQGVYTRAADGAASVSFGAYIARF